ncbi:MAG: ThiF family adenylyltransferase, partial [Pseudonocardiaceae bacterium]
MVGAGALGQNLLVNLALAGIGRIDIVDHDVFEDHNRTRSPCYPTPSEQTSVGLGKAKAVAHKILPMMTAAQPVVCYAAARIQDIGDEAIERADVVCSAVDNAAARHYLADRCWLHGKPMVEGGFEGSRLNLSVFAPDPQHPCYRCIVPSRTGVFSCDRYAVAAEAARIVPAIQNGAAALAALQAEQVIEALHGRASLVSKRMFADIRTLSFRVLTLSLDTDCEGAHQAPPEHVEIDLGPSATVAQLVELARSRFGDGQLR